MVWVRIDENFAQHPKVLRAGPLGMAMQIAALCYCNRHMTDGFVPKQIAKGLLDLDGLGMRMSGNGLMGAGLDAEWHLVVEDLVEAGLWDEVDGGWQIHDYLDFQPSRQQIQRVSETRREAGRRGGSANRKQTPEQIAKHVAKQNGEQIESKSSSKSSSKTEAKSKPVPVSRIPIETPPVAPPCEADIPGFLDRRKSNGEAKRRKQLDWDELPEEARTFCRQKRPDLDPDRTFERFRDYWIGHGKPMKDWMATWRNWVRKENAAPAPAADKWGGS